MKYVIGIMGLCLCLVACNSQEEELDTSTENEVVETKEDLIVTENGMYTEYYPGKEKIRFQGPQDDNKKRNGIWKFYNENGTEQSMTEYRHGLKHGVTIVRHPNGQIYYTGEYSNDVQIGVWRTYDQNGKQVSEKDYGTPE